MTTESFRIAVFKSVNHVMMAEGILKKHHFPIKLIPIPRNISSDCGVCIRFTPDLKSSIQDLLIQTGLEFQIYDLERPASI